MISYLLITYSSEEAVLLVCMWLAVIIVDSLYQARALPMIGIN